MPQDYCADDIEKIAQSYWEEHQCFSVQEDINKEKFFCLAMFPYPSGQLHMGHIRNYTLADVVSRYQRMLGKHVLQPIGWDAFGLPAENAAISHNTQPATWTYQNIKQMRAQMKRLGFAYDWQRELATCKPEYYRWEQWFFLQCYKNGLVYKKRALVNWDPVDQTVLANEQVIDGRGWRSNALVEQKEIPMWFLKITKYTEELLKGLDELTGWPKQVVAMQRNWIGRSTGVEVFFPIADKPFMPPLKIFTSRIETLMGVTYLCISPDHPLAQSLSQQVPTIDAFTQKCRAIQRTQASLDTCEKLGLDTGYQAIHPITQRYLPIWIANYVLMDYGTGAIMAVPGHDQRDWEFAKQYQLPMIAVIQPAEGVIDLEQGPSLGTGTLINSAPFENLELKRAQQVITEALMQRQLGRVATYSRLRDWAISRQRYWGAPIPMIYCEQCGAVPVPEKDLPVKLPEDVEFTGAQSPLSQMPEFYHTTCPQCGASAHRETDTFDTFVESSWYYARFASHDQDHAMLDERACYWTPVDYYVGGIEHAVLHLLYARFFHKVMRDLGLLNSKEPFTTLLTQGMVLYEGKKMSKSKGNVVSPNELIERYGADTVRLFIIFAAPPSQSLEWADSGVAGAYRFLRKLWQFGHGNEAIEMVNKTRQNKIESVIHWQSAEAYQIAMRRAIYEILQQVLFDYQRSQFNTVVSGCMKLFNLISQPDSHKLGIIDKYLVYEGYLILLRLLAPIVPHITHVLWEQLGFEHPIIDAPWPKVAKEALKLSTATYVIQVNGKLKGNMEVPLHAEAPAIEQLAKAHPAVQACVQAKTFCKAIVIPNRRLINLVYKNEKS